jgi:hypothetical protein
LLDQRSKNIDKVTNLGSNVENAQNLSKKISLNDYVSSRGISQLLKNDSTNTESSTSQSLINDDKNNGEIFGESKSETSFQEQVKCDNSEDTFCEKSNNEHEDLRMEEYLPRYETDPVEMENEEDRKMTNKRSFESNHSNRKISRTNSKRSKISKKKKKSKTSKKINTIKKRSKHKSKVSSKHSSSSSISISCSSSSSPSLSISVSSSSSDLSYCKSDDEHPKPEADNHTIKEFHKVTVGMAVPQTENEDGEIIEDGEINDDGLEDSEKDLSYSRYTGHPNARDFDGGVTKKMFDNTKNKPNQFELNTKSFLVNDSSKQNKPSSQAQEIGVLSNGQPIETGSRASSNSVHKSHGLIQNSSYFDSPSDQFDSYNRNVNHFQKKYHKFENFKNNSTIGQNHSRISFTPQGSNDSNRLHGDKFSMPGHLGK